MGFFISSAGLWIALAVVLAGVAVILRRGPGGANARVVLRLQLEPRRSLYVVDIAGRHLVLGSSEGGVSMLTELDAQAVQRLVVEPAAPPAWRALWKRA